MSNLLEQINKTKEYILGDICLSSGGGTPSTTIQEYWNGDIPWLTPTEISNVDFCFVSDTKRKITQKGLESSSAKLMPEYSILMSSRANIGDVVINTVPMTTNQGFINMIPNKELVDLYYFSYWLRTRKNYFIQVSTGSTFLELSKSTFREIPINLPDLSTQKKIAKILSAYDAKIENNNFIIKKLEAAAQTLFDEWFVNFKFPGYEKVKFVDSEMGEIPDGWNIKNVLDVIERISPGKKYDNKSASPSGSVPILDQGASGFIGYHDDEPGVIASIDNPVVVFTNHTCYYRILTEPFSCIQNVLPYIGKNGYDTFFVYFLTKEKIKMSEYKGHWPEFEQQVFVIPTPEIANQFSKIAKAFIEKIITCEKENVSLKSQRDRLLAKLI